MHSTKRTQLNLYPANIVVHTKWKLLQQDTGRTDICGQMLDLKELKDLAEVIRGVVALMHLGMFTSDLINIDNQETWPGWDLGFKFENLPRHDWYKTLGENTPTCAPLNSTSNQEMSLKGLLYKWPTCFFSTIKFLPPLPLRSLEMQLRKLLYEL